MVFAFCEPKRAGTVVVGHAATISAGERITATGEWVNDRTHGQQFKARFLRTSPPTSADGITLLPADRLTAAGVAGLSVAHNISLPVGATGQGPRSGLGAPGTAATLKLSSKAAPWQVRLHVRSATR